MKAIIIARVSTEEQRDAGNSLPAQITRLERYCQNKKLLESFFCESSTRLAVPDEAPFGSEEWRG